MFYLLKVNQNLTTNITVLNCINTNSHKICMVNATKAQKVALYTSINNIKSLVDRHNAALGLKEWKHIMKTNVNINQLKN